MLLNALNTALSRRLNLPLLRIAHRTVCEMAKVFVRSVEEEERLQISFKYHPDNQQAPAHKRVYNFDRLKTEGLERTVTRIATKINQNLTKKAKKKSKSLGVDVTPSDVRVCLSDNGSVIDLTEPNVSAWTDGRCMHIEDQLFHVCVNVPTIRKLSLPEPMMVGFPVYAKLDLEFADVSDCEFTWYRLSNDVTSVPLEESDSLPSDDAEDQESSMPKKCKQRKQSEQCVEVSVGRSYIPTAEDIGCRLKVECIPKRGEVTGEIVGMVSSDGVQSGPTVSCPFEKRHRFTEHLTSGDWLVLARYTDITIMCITLF